MRTLSIQQGRDKMIIREVLTLEEAQIVRDIRNSMRNYMTRNAAFISSAQQKVRFEALKHSNDKLFLYYDDNHASIGYGLWRLGGALAWGTLALKEEYHNQGYGTEIYKHLISLNGELWIEIFSDNRPSLIAAMKAGFDIIDIRDKIVILRATKENK